MAVPATGDQSGEDLSVDVPRTALATLREYVSRLDAARLTTDRAASLLEVFAEIERVAVGARLVLALRAAEGTRWARAGHRSAASWLATVTGAGMGDAMQTLDTATRLQGLPKTEEAVRRGQLSSAQAREVAAAGAADPNAESALLDAAAVDSLKQLKDRARRVRAAAASQQSHAEREERVRRARYLRSWSDEDGAFRLDAKLPATDGAQVMAALEAQARTHFDEARQAGRPEPEAAYLADALVVLCTTGKPGKQSRGAPRASVHVRVDLAALRRGRLEPGETCEIPGIGPVSVATARGLVGDCFLKLLVTDGVDVQSVVHVGRTIPATVRTALEERDPACVVPGCGATRFLQIDHWQVDFADGGPSALWNLARLCPHHHQLKTRGQFELAGGPGKWEFRRVREPSARQPTVSVPRRTPAGAIPARC